MHVQWSTGSWITFSGIFSANLPYTYGFCNRIDKIYFDEIANIESHIENVQNLNLHKVWHLLFVIALIWISELSEPLTCRLSCHYTLNDNIIVCVFKMVLQICLIKRIDNFLPKSFSSILKLKSAWFKLIEQ